MAADRSFTNYVAKRFDNNFWAVAEQYLNDNQDSLCSDLRRIHRVGEMESSDVKVEHVWVNDSPGMKIQFDVALSIGPEIAAGDRHYNDSEEKTVRIMARCRGDLDYNIDDFEIIEVTGYNDKNRTKNPMGDDLVPVMFPDNLDAIAEQFLRDHYKKALLQPAWYSVLEFHVHLSGIWGDGAIKDGLENTVLKLHDLSCLQSSASKIEIKNKIVEFDKELHREKMILTQNVPYKALSGFANKSLERIDLNSSAGRMMAYYNRINVLQGPLPYTFGEQKGLERKIIFHDAWIKMIQDNMLPILGWIQFEKIRWLQNNNPEVPGLVYKLMPMDSLLNSAKGNRLPQWDKFFIRFAKNQHIMYELIHEKPECRKLYETCYRDNLHSVWASQELYRQGNSREEFYGILEKNMRYVYDSARRQGYQIWMVE